MHDRFQMRMTFYTRCVGKLTAVHERGDGLPRMRGGVSHYLYDCRLRTEPCLLEFIPIKLQTLTEPDESGITA
jgi:hypothetical protein